MIIGVEMDCYCFISFMFYVCNVFFDAFTRAPLRFTDIQYFIAFRSDCLIAPSFQGFSFSTSKQKIIAFSGIVCLISSNLHITLKSCILPFQEKKVLRHVLKPWNEGAIRQSEQKLLYKWSKQCWITTSFLSMANNIIQQDGVAIGSKLGSNYACAYMRKWDEELAIFSKQPMRYFRYIDDGFGIWLHGEDSLKELHEFANNIHQDIKVELRYSSKNIEIPWHDGNPGEGANYHGPIHKADWQAYICWQKIQSPFECKKVPAVRSRNSTNRRICSRESDYLKRRGELKSYIRKRGYSSKFIESQQVKVDKMDRSDLLVYKDKKKNQNRVPLVETYAKQLPDIQKISRDHMPLLHNSERMQHILEEPPLVVFRRDRNLSDILVHGKHNKIFKNRDEDHGCSKQKACSIYLLITCEASNAIEIRTDRRNNCETTNVIYGLDCGECNKYRIWNEFSFHTVFMKRVVWFISPNLWRGDIKHTTSFINTVWNENSFQILFITI